MSKKFLYSIEEDLSDAVNFKGIYSSLTSFLKELNKDEKIKKYTISKYKKNKNLPPNRGKGEIIVEYFGHEERFFYHRAIVDEFVIM